jgi:hypothetical protein
VTGGSTGSNLNPLCGSKSSELFYERRTVMINPTLIDATYYGLALLFIMIGILGLSIEDDITQMTGTVRQGDRIAVKVDE